MGWPKPPGESPKKEFLAYYLSLSYHFKYRGNCECLSEIDLDWRKWNRNYVYPYVFSWQIFLFKEHCVLNSNNICTSTSISVARKASVILTWIFFFSFFWVGVCLHLHCRIPLLLQSCTLEASRNAHLFSSRMQSPALSELFAYSSAVWTKTSHCLDCLVAHYFVGDNISSLMNYELAS